MQIQRTSWASRLGSTAATAAPLAGGALALGADLFAPVGVAGGAVLTARAARELIAGRGDRLTHLCTLAAGLTLTASSALAFVPGPLGATGRLLAAGSLAALTLPSLAQSAPHLKNALLGPAGGPTPEVPTSLPAFIPGRRDFYRKPVDAPPDGQPLLREKCLFIQLDGLSAPELQEAMQRGFMPNLQKLLESGDYVVDTWRCGLPSCTPAVQAGILHGNQEAMPGFRWYDKTLGKFITGFEMKDHATNFAPRATTKNPGLISGGAGYTNQYTAGARQEAFNAEGLSTLLSTRDRREADGEARALRAYFERPSDVIDSLIHVPLEVGADFLDHMRSPEREDNLKSWATHPAIPIQRAIPKNTWIRDVTTSAMKQDLANDEPVIFVDYGGYDSVGHLYNPTSLAALKSLRGIDRKVGELVREAGPDRKIFLFSDHGQTPSVPFHKEFGQTFQEFLGDDVVYASSGNLSHLYLKSLPQEPTLEQVERQAPGWVSKLIQHPGIQLVVGRQPDGIEIRGKQGSYFLKNDGTSRVTGQNPLAPYPDQPEVLAAQMADLFTPEVSGDVIVFGAAQDNRVVDLEDVYAMGVGLQFGAHGGVGGRQTLPFLVYPKDVPLETGAMQNSSDLYYQLVHHLGR